jgi:hypothetical protein
VMWIWRLACGLGRMNPATNHKLQAKGKDKFLWLGRYESCHKPPVSGEMEGSISRLSW